MGEVQLVGGFWGRFPTRSELGAGRVGHDRGGDDLSTVSVILRSPDESGRPKNLRRGAFTRSPSYVRPAY